MGEAAKNFSFEGFSEDISDFSDSKVLYIFRASVKIRDIVEVK